MSGLSFGFRQRGHAPISAISSLVQGRRYGLAVADQQAVRLCLADFLISLDTISEKDLHTCDRDFMVDFIRLAFASIRQGRSSVANEPHSPDSDRLPSDLLHEEAGGFSFPCAHRAAGEEFGEDGRGEGVPGVKSRRAALVPRQSPAAVAVGSDIVSPQVWLS